MDWEALFFYLSLKRKFRNTSSVLHLTRPEIPASFTAQDKDEKQRTIFCIHFDKGEWWFICWVTVDFIHHHLSFKWLEQLYCIRRLCSWIWVCWIQYVLQKLFLYLYMFGFCSVVIVSYCFGFVSVFCFWRGALISVWLDVINYSVKFQLLDIF